MSVALGLHKDLSYDGQCGTSLCILITFIAYTQKLPKMGK